MKKMVVILGGVVALAGCRQALSPEVLREYQSRTLFTCCNIRHEGDQINDANYAVGTLLPLGAKATVQGAGRDSITFVADGTKLTLSHSYGTKEETFQQYI